MFEVGIMIGTHRPQKDLFSYHINLDQRVRQHSCHLSLNLARAAATQTSRKVPVKCIVVSLKGEVLQEEWV